MFDTLKCVHGGRGRTRITALELDVGSWAQAEARRLQHVNIALFVSSPHIGELVVRAFSRAFVREFGVRSGGGTVSVGAEIQCQLDVKDLQSSWRTDGREGAEKERYAIAIQCDITGSGVGVVRGNPRTSRDGV